MRHPTAHPPVSARRPGPRRVWGPLAALTIVGLLAGAAPAAAHDALVGSDPADGAVLSVAPTQVVLTFAAPQAEIGAEVVVIGPDGATWSEGPAQSSDVTVTQPLLPSMPDGAYVVTWRSVGSDGHPVSGSLGFTLQLPVGPDPDPSTGTDPDAVAPDDATADAVAEPLGATATPAAPGSVVTAADPLAPAALDEQPDGGWLWWYSLVLAILLAAAAGGAVMWRRRAARG